MWIKLACFAVFTAIMVVLHWATTGFARFMGPEFTWGAVCGGLFVSLMVLLGSAIDRRESAEQD